jgi:hypothetical protein
MPTNKELKTSFDFPKFLTVGDYSQYQKFVADALAKLGKEENQTPMQALAVIFVAARDAGLIQNWRSETMPDLMTDEVKEMHAFLIVWVAQQVSEWINSQRDVDPKSFWRRLMSWIEMARRLLSWLARGVVKDSPVSREGEASQTSTKAK